MDLMSTTYICVKKLLGGMAPRVITRNFYCGLITKASKFLLYNPATKMKIVKMMNETYV